MFDKQNSGDAFAEKIKVSVSTAEKSHVNVSSNENLSAQSNEHLKGPETNVVTPVPPDDSGNPNPDTPNSTEEPETPIVDVENPEEPETPADSETPVEDDGELSEELLVGMLADSIAEGAEYAFEEGLVDDLPKLLSSIEDQFLEKKVLNPESEIFKKVKDRIFAEYGITDEIARAAESSELGFDSSAYNQYAEINEFVNSEIKTPEGMQEVFRLSFIYGGANEKDALEMSQLRMTQSDADKLQESYKGALAAVKAKTTGFMSEMNLEKDKLVKANSSHIQAIQAQTDLLLAKRIINGKEYSEADIALYTGMVVGRGHEIELPGGKKIKVSAYQAKEHNLSVEEQLQRSIDFALDGLSQEEKVRKNKEVSGKKRLGKLMSRVNKFKSINIQTPSPRVVSDSAGQQGAEFEDLGEKIKVKMN